MSDDDLLPLDAKAGGMLLKAFREEKTDQIQWVDVTVGDVIVTVASDAMKGPLNGKTGVRLPVSYQEAVTICAALDCISPNQAICDAMFAQAKAQLTAVPLVITAADAAHITQVGFVLRFHERVEEQLSKAPPSPGDLVFGAWKLWILHPRIVERGAINYGFWDKSHHPPRVIQTVGGQHDASHYDYSQLLVPVKRMAKSAATGEPVDLVDYIATHDKVPAQYLDPYRGAK